MNKLVRGLLASLLAVHAVHATVNTDRTFIAHRDYLNNSGMNWATKHHHLQKGNHRTLGATFTVTPFYEASTNEKGLAKLFGMGDTGKITVAENGMTVSGGLSADTHDKLYGHLVDHTPTLTTAAMRGDVLLKPKRRSWGTELSWNQSLDTILKGLRLSVRMPVMEVQTSMRATTIGTASTAATTDGPKETLDTYFAGKLVKDIATYSKVSQKGLSHSRIDNQWHSATGIGDIDVRLDWQCYSYKNMAFTASAGLQIPAGNSPDGKWLMEPVYGARRHIAAGLSAAMHADGFSKGDVKFSFDVVADWKHFFSGTEKRALGLYDLVNKKVLPGSSYHNVMRHEHLGVQPAANVLTVDHEVYPGHQFEGLAGASAAWCNWTFDLGYNIFWHEKEALELKDSAWNSDRHAIASATYNMASVATHKNQIGVKGAGVDYASVNGPIQGWGQTQSTLHKAVRYNVTSSNAVTDAQLTHSAVAGVGYKCTGEYPVVLGLGGQLEFQDNSRNSALEGYKVWAKVAVNF